MGDKREFFLDKNLDYTTLMYFDDVDSIEYDDGQNDILALFFELRAIIGKLNELFLDIGYFSSSFKYVDIYQKMSMCVDKEIDIIKRDKLNDLYHEFISIRNKITEVKLDLVFEVVKGFSRDERIDIDDIIQWGNFGLLKAIETFNPYYDKGFDSYAKKGISMFIIANVFKDASLFYIPNETLNGMYHLRLYMDSFYGKFGREPSDLELSKGLNLSLKTINTIRKAIELGNYTNKVDEIVDDGMDIDSLIIQNEMKMDVNNMFSVLSDKQELVLKYRYGFYDDRKFKLMELEKILGLTYQGVLYREQQGLKKLKRSFTLNKMYLEDNC